MGARIRAFDWASHPLGPSADWPEALRTALSLCLDSSFPTAIYWGPELYLLYNDAWSEIPADKHPGVLGLPARAAWPDIWHIVGPQFASVLATGQGIALYEQMLPMLRGGAVREAWWNYSFSAIRNADHSVGGVFNQGNDVTEMVHARRERQAETERWRELFRQAPAPVAWLRGPAHVFAFANDAFLRLVGGRDVLGQTVRDALPEVVEQGFVSLLDQVYRTGEPYLGTSVDIRLRQAPGGPPEDRRMDFVYQPVRDAAGQVDGVFVLVTDVTERTRVEHALRVSNWQLGEERARLASAMEAEQRAQQALRRFNDALEAHVKQRTAQLERALAEQQAVADRLRAISQTGLIFQGYTDPDGTLLDTNEASLAAIRCRLGDVIGRPFWTTPWFAGDAELQELVRDAVRNAAGGRTVRATVTLNLPAGPRRYDFTVRPALNAGGEVVGLVPEAVDVTDRAPAGPA